MVLHAFLPIVIASAHKKQAMSIGSIAKRKKIILTKVKYLVQITHLISRGQNLNQKSNSVTHALLINFF